MVWDIFTHSVVALVCWNLLPQPAIVKRFYDRVRAWWNRVTTRDYDPFD